MRISDWSSDVCSSDLIDGRAFKHAVSPQSIPLFARQYLIGEQFGHAQASPASLASTISSASSIGLVSSPSSSIFAALTTCSLSATLNSRTPADLRPITRRESSPMRMSFKSEEHTSELQSLMRISYAVFCLKKKKNTQQPEAYNNHSPCTLYTS